jgi:hypothetical protein
LRRESPRRPARQPIVPGASSFFAAIPLSPVLNLRLLNILPSHIGRHVILEARFFLRLKARFVIDEITAKRDYQHRLMDYNNDATTTFADIQKVFRLLEAHIKNRLKEQSNQSPR